MNTVSIDWRDIAEPLWTGRAEAFAGRVLESLGKDDWTLSLLFCGDEFIQTLNRDYRGRDEATDVLSFCMGDTVEDEGRSLFLAGDIVISLPALARNAIEFSVPEDEELRRLIVHGILHLSGLDHCDNDPAQPMLQEQERLLASLQ
ncbi:rRNA maturation RNase YbeY, partial [bacterium]|nr:rRNA maturation RNase YbeY [bacterium]